jgi:hypothetical protein
MDQEAKSDWNVFAAAVIGASCGAALVMLHQGNHVLSDNVSELNPFLHIITELTLASVAGALLFAAGAVLFHRFLLSKS